MQFLFVFPNIIKSKNADVSRTHGVCHVIYMFFWSSLDRMERCYISYLHDIWNIFWRWNGGGRRFQASHTIAASKTPILNRVKWYLYLKWSLVLYFFGEVEVSVTLLSVFSMYCCCCFFFYLGFLSQTFMIYRTAGEEGGYFFRSSLPLPPSSQALTH